MADLRNSVVGRLLPLFIDTAGGNAVLARAMIRDQIDGLAPNSIQDLLRVARIVGLRASAVGNLRLSMDVGQDPQSCWRTAASLSNTADRIVRLRNQRQTGHGSAPTARP